MEMIKSFLSQSDRHGLPHDWKAHIQFTHIKQRMPSPFAQKIEVAA